jgi:PAS domain S-box-containing protein
MKPDHVGRKLAPRISAIRLKLIEYGATHSLNELMTKALDETSELVDSPIGFFKFVEADQKYLAFQQWSTRTTTEFCQAEGAGLHYPIERAGVWADCVRQRKPIIHNDYASLESRQGLPPGHAEVIRELVLPVMRKDKVVAVLGVGNKPVDYNQMDVEIVSYLADLTWEIVQRKRTEEALVDSEKRYRRLFESAKDGILILDAHTGMVVDVNPFLTRLLGYSHEDLCGKLIWEIGTFKDISSSKEAFEALQENEYIRYDNLPLETADGRKIEVEFVSNVYLVDHAKVIQCNIRDITERKQAEAERERLLAAIEQAGEMIVITDAEGFIQYVNPAFERVTGYTRQEAIGQNPRLLKSGQQDQEFYQNLWGTISGGGTFRERMVNRRKDGTFFTEEATISPVRNPQGRIISYVAVKHDITDRLQLSAQLLQAQKMEAVGRLAGGVAHDYNNMLSVIIGYTELALDKVNPPDPLHENLTEILKAALRSTEITRQLLAFARKQTISPKVLDVNQTVAGMLNMLRRLIGEDIDLAWLPVADPWSVKIDPAQIDQILANLCVNARDAIAGVGKVTIETHRATFDADYCDDHAGYVPGEYMLLAVSDDGCGMDKETLDHAFEPFFTTKDLNRGTGLGLAMVFGVVRQNNGFINIYSEPGKGTTFKVYLPRHVGPTEKTRTETLAEIPPSQHEMVLLVEDEPSIRKMGQIMLERLGYQVLAAGTPRQAMTLAKEHSGEIHLLITDVVMPEMNGRDLATHMHLLYPDVKILFMSGYTADVIAHRGVLEDGVNFIQKPFSMKDLGFKVREALSWNPGQVAPCKPPQN